MHFASLCKGAYKKPKNSIFFKSSTHLCQGKGGLKIKSLKVFNLFYNNHVDERVTDTFMILRKYFDANYQLKGGQDTIFYETVTQ